MKHYREQERGFEIEDIRFESGDTRFDLDGIHSRHRVIGGNQTADRFSSVVLGDAGFDERVVECGGVHVQSLTSKATAPTTTTA